MLKIIKIKSKLLYLLLFFLLLILTFSSCDGVVTDETVESIDDKYILTIDIKGEGETEPEPGAHEITDGEIVDIKAIPNDGYYFIEWEGNVQDSDTAKTSILMESNETVTAVFGEMDELQVLIYYGHEPLGEHWGGINDYNKWITSLGNAGMEVSLDNSEPLTSMVISNYDVVIILAPTKAFSQSELDAIAEFADGGLMSAGGDLSIFHNRFFEALNNKKWGVKLIEKLKASTNGNVFLVLGEHGKMLGGDHNIYNQLLNPTGKNNPGITIENTIIKDEVYNWQDEEGEDRLNWPIVSSVFDEISENLYMTYLAGASLKLRDDAIPLARASQESYIEQGIESTISQTSFLNQGSKGYYESVNSFISSKIAISQQYENFLPIGEVVLAYVEFEK